MECVNTSGKRKTAIARAVVKEGTGKVTVRLYWVKDDKEKFFEGACCSFDFPTCSSLSIDVVLTDISGISTLASSNWTWQRKGDHVLLSKVPAGVKVQLYDLRGMLLQAVVSEGKALDIPLSSGQFHILRVGDKTVKL